MRMKETARDVIEQERATLVALSHKIHGHPEVAFQEVHASEWMCSVLGGAGFRIEEGICQVPTAFSATVGSGGLTIALCAEYDALPEIGHACGHNIIATAAVAAGLALAPIADALGITVKVLGTPAEEGGGGKILLLERGGFDGVHAAMMVHPSPEEVADPGPMVVAVSHLQVSYTGRESQASGWPERGVNAADALTVAQVAIGLLRQHILPRQRIHGIVTLGGAAANIVPAHTKGTWFVRAATIPELAKLEPRVRACFEAGALATGCKLEIEYGSPTYSNFEADQQMVELYRRNAERLGRSFPAQADVGGPGSTDMGNVSLALPAIQPMVRIECGTSLPHQPEYTSYCIEPSADKAALEGGLAMAWTAIDLATDPASRERLEAERQRRGAPSKAAKELWGA